MSLLEVLDGGLLTTIQDAGRPGLGHLGIAASGYLDAPAARLANRLVGNDDDAAVLETTLAGPKLRVTPGPDGDPSATVTIAVTGAPAPILVDARLADPNAAIVLHAGQILSVGRVTAGVRSYLAVRGGIAVEPVLASRSTDLMSGLGPPPLASGQLLPVGPATGDVPTADFVPTAAIKPEAEVGVVLGPSDDWFDPSAVAVLTSTAWSVGSTSGRIGLRLEGPPLRRRDSVELPPEGMVTGSIQVPPNGQPVVLLADRPVTGGYPVIGVVRESDLASLAQAAPGTVVRFRLRQVTGRL